MIGHQEAIIERVVDFTHEISVVAARGLDGQFAHYGAIENVHHNHILDVAMAPARVPAELASEAVHLAHRVLDDLGLRRRVVRGVFCHSRSTASS